MKGTKAITIRNESGSRPGKFYETVIWTDGRTSCNCPGWIYKKPGKERGCKHVHALNVKAALRTVSVPAPAPAPAPAAIPATLMAQLEASVSQATGRKFRFVEVD